MKQKPSTLASLENAGVYRSGRWLVRGVSLNLQSREILTLIGPNGSGKSITAKVVLGLLKPDEGISNLLPGVKVAYVPQKISIDWTLPLTVRKFVRLTGGVSKADAESAMNRTEVMHLQRAEVRHLSGGEFQRVLLARAISRKPELLVLDEPVQGVDFTGEIALYDLIKKIRDEIQCGILLISHDLHVVMAATDKVLCLNGHVCCSGTPNSVIESEEYKQLFGPKAATTLAVYEHNHDHTHSDDGRVKNNKNTVEIVASDKTSKSETSFRANITNTDNNDG